MKIQISLSAPITRPPIAAAPFRAFLLSLGIPDGVAEKLAGDGIVFTHGAYEKRIALRENAVNLKKLLTETLGEPDDEPEMVGVRKPKFSGNTAYTWDVPGKGFITLNVNRTKQCTFSVVTNSQFLTRR